MPFRTIPGSDTKYGLLCFGADGTERADDPDGLMSRRLVEITSAGDITNIFLFSHGWMGDVPAAIRQYDLWINAFASSTRDRQKAETVFPGFKPLFIGLHWPSLPWGEEELTDGSFAIGEDTAPVDLYSEYLARLGDTPEIRAALRTILNEAAQDAAPEQLSDSARQAFLDLNSALGLESHGVGAGPDADREPFDPDEALAAGNGVAYGGVDVFDGMLGVLRLCSYWKMKQRARSIGEGGMHSFVNALQQATAAKKTRIHLMGHSFGCVVVSSILSGPGCAGTFERPIDSVVLAQGAVSLWSYAAAIPFPGVGAGYFHPVLTQRKVRGPIVTTQSSHDTAVGVQYPRACVVSGEASFDVTEYPKYGAVGTFGFQGLPDDAKSDTRMLAADGEYQFAGGRIYNLESSQYIAKGGGSSGAHNDIGGPEVAHAIWSAAFAAG